MHCVVTFLGICLSRPPAEAGPAIFGFGEFLTALALLVLVFNSTDHLYRFRISVAPLPLYNFTFGSIVIIGGGTLLTDLWFAERWYALPFGASRAELQVAFGALFLFTALLWMWFAFIRPPTFGRFNYKRFHRALFHTVVKGADANLAVIATELSRSAKSLVELTAPRRHQEDDRSMQLGNYAHDTLLLIANTKLCRHIVATAPATAIIFMTEAGRAERYDIPLGQFASAITTQALRNKDSILFHEDDLSSDLMGHLQPFRKAMYGDFRLVEGLSHVMLSPLDVDWRLASKLDADQFEAYCQIVFLTFKSYVAGGSYLHHSYTLYRAFGVIKAAGNGLYDLEDVASNTSGSDASKRLSAAVQFVADVIDFLAEQPNLHFGPLRVGRGLPHRRETIFDHIADVMFELIHSAAYVRTDPERTWWIQHNTVWGRFFAFRARSAAWDVIRFKLFRLLFDEIRHLEEFPNYKGARILGFCLNIFGFREPKRGEHGNEFFSLRKAVISWTRRNYLWLKETNPEIAAHSLAGSITFDEGQSRLVKSYASMAGRDPAREYLELDDPPPRMPAE